MFDALEIVADFFRFGVKVRRRSKYHELLHVVVLWTPVSIIAVQIMAL